VDLYEYQGRELFARHGLPVLDGGVATTPEEARAIAERLGGRVVVKAQVKVGGRGKAGGVKLADGVEEAQARARDILGMDIKGHTVHKVMVTTTADIEEEYYFSYLLDRANRTFLCIASVAGGMEIEQVAHEAPEKVVKEPIDANAGVDEAKARDIVTRAGFPADVAEQVVAIAGKLWQAFVAEDATLVEVNPLAKVLVDRRLAGPAQVPAHDDRRLAGPAQVPAHDGRAA
jgi:succinyl-CoA synthetase beta subunit